MKRNKLAEARAAKHWTRAVAADKLGIDLNTLYRWEAGKTSPREYNVCKLCEIYGKNSEELGLDRVGEDNFLRVSTDRTTQTTEETFTPLSLTNPSYSSISKKQNVSPDDEIQQLVDQLSKTLSKKTIVDRVTLKQLEVCTEGHWKYHNEGVVPSQDIFRNVAQHLHYVLSLLEGSLSLSARLQLCTTISSTALLSGALLFDLSVYDKAREFQSFALLAAQEGNNPKWEAVAWGVIALSWVYGRDLYQALGCVQQGRSIAVKPVSVTVCAWLAAIEAEIQAKLKHTDACLHALDDAAISFPSEEDSYWTGYDKIRMEGYKGACLKLLYDPKKPTTKIYLANAQTALLSGIAQSNTAVHETRAIYLCDLASTYVLQRDIEGACTLASQALTANIRHSRLVFQRIIMLREELDKWKQTVWVVRLDSQLEALKDRV